MLEITCNPLRLTAIEVSDTNYQSVCDFVFGHRPSKASNPTYPRNRYFGVFVETRYGRQLAHIGDYIVRTGETDYRVYTREEFMRTFKIEAEL